MRRNFEILGFSMGWFAVIAQLILALHNRQTEVGEALLRFFSYFTILTNTLVALYFTVRVFGLKRRAWILFHRRPTPMALTAFILVVGLVYQVVLRQIWNPTGLQQVVDELLHTVIPIFMYVYWLLFTSKNLVGWKELQGWLLYPLLYLVWVLVRGRYSGFYPYPFLDLDTLGSMRTLLNSALVLVVIILVMAALYFLGRLLRPKQ
jgi:hypothetical protein